MGEERLHRYLAVFEEGAHLVLLIAFGHVGHMDTARGISCLLERNIRCGQFLTSLPDEDILRIHAVCHRGIRLLMVVAQRHRDIHRSLGEGHEEDVLKGFHRPLRFFRRKPLLEQTRERMPIDHLPVGLRAHSNFAVALQGHLVKSLPSAIPMGQAHELVYIELLMLMIACESVVKP